MYLSGILQTHPPSIIFDMLVVPALLCFLLAGYGMSGSIVANRTHAIAFALVVTATIYVILDLEFPRVGAIRIDAADQLLVDVRDSMR